MQVVHQPFTWHELPTPLANTGHSYATVSSIYITQYKPTHNKNVANTTKYFTFTRHFIFPSHVSAFMPQSWRALQKHSRTVAIYYNVYTRIWGYAVAQLVEALRYDPESRRFDSRCDLWRCSLLNPSGRTMALGSTQPLTEMSTRTISCGERGPFAGLTTLPPSCADCLEILGASTFLSPKVLSGRVMG
jgi:hypothetical protein